MAEQKAVIFDIKAVNNLIMRRVDQLMSRGSDDEITGMQGAVIGYLSDHQTEEVFQKDLEDIFRIRRSTATGILQLMEKNGLIERHGVAYDARLKRLHLTEKALKRHELFLDSVRQVEDEVLRGLSEDEKLTFRYTLFKIRKNCESQQTYN